MAKILLTRNIDGADISIEDSLLLKAYTANSLTTVEYLDDEDGYRKKVVVNEALALVGGMSSLLVSVTLADASAAWINFERVTSVGENNSEAVLLFDNAGAALEQITLSTTAAAWKASVISKSGDFEFDTLLFANAPEEISLAVAAGDQSAKFTVGVVFTVFGEGNANDAIYSVVSSAHGTETVITVNETIAVAGAGAGKVWVKA